MANVTLYNFIEHASSQLQTEKRGDVKNMNNNISAKDLNKLDTGFKVIGYYPDWVTTKHDRIQYDILTHIVYSFAIPDEDGTIKPLGNPENAKMLIKDAHENNIKILIGIGGWSYNDLPLEPVFKLATDSREKIEILTDEIMKLVSEYGFDGVDIDWGHPRFGDVTQDQYTSLIKSLHKSLKENNLLLTSAVLSGVSVEGTIMYDSAAHTDDNLQYLDWINVMAYDGGDGDRHSPYEFGVNSANYWIKTRGLDKRKVILGVPFYGRPSWAPYSDLLELNPNADKSDISVIRGMEAHYNGVATITKKSQWAKANTGGMMIWELSQDTSDKSKSLLSAIGKAIK